MLTRLIVMLVALGLFAAGAPVRAQAPRIEVEALFTDTAMLKINGQRATLRTGQSHAGVTLLGADSGSATLQVNGEKMVVGVSRHIGANFQQPQQQRVTIRRDRMLQYHTTALINGRSAQVLVDTGANVVAMSAAHARALGVDYSAGIASQVATAAGPASARLVTLRAVSVGGIEVNNVPASVVEGDFPATILLGMTYLRHVRMEEDNGVLSLSRAR